MRIIVDSYRLPVCRIFDTA